MVGNDGSFFTGSFGSVFGVGKGRAAGRFCSTAFRGKVAAATATLDVLCGTSFPANKVDKIPLLLCKNKICIIPLPHLKQKSLS